MNWSFRNSLSNWLIRDLLWNPQFPDPRSQLHYVSQNEIKSRKITPLRMDTPSFCRGKMLSQLQVTIAIPFFSFQVTLTISVSLNWHTVWISIVSDQRPSAYLLASARILSWNEMSGSKTDSSSDWTPTSSTPGRNLVCIGRKITQPHKWLFPPPWSFASLIF